MFGTANENYEIADFWLSVSKKVNNIISKSIKNACFKKVSGLWLKK